MHRNHALRCETPPQFPAEAGPRIAFLLRLFLLTADPMRICRCDADSAANAEPSSLPNGDFGIWYNRLKNALWPSPNVSVFPLKEPLVGEDGKKIERLPVEQRKVPQTGWERVLEMYDDGDIHMEIDVTRKVTRAAFIGGFFFGGYNGHMMNKERYDMHAVGRKFLNARDAMKRRLDYSIVMFAKNGFRMGIKSAALVGSVVFLSTHITRYRDRFSLAYFPAISASVGSMLAFPVGIIGSMKALGLGITSGISLSMVAFLYALTVDKSIDEAYKQFRTEYEADLREEHLLNQRAVQLMHDEKIFWKQSAIRKIKKMDEAKLLENDV
uniref:Complex I assembly factor TIMMDC1, mitochondrial n=2 Tax=Steinernema glaseri TaxID=37863 RepID=A0A1I8ABE5_9BILA